MQILKFICRKVNLNSCPQVPLLFSPFFFFGFTVWFMGPQWGLNLLQQWKSEILTTWPQGTPSIGTFLQIPANSVVYFYFLLILSTVLKIILLVSLHELLNFLFGKLPEVDNMHGLRFPRSEEEGKTCEWLAFTLRAAPPLSTDCPCLF